MIILRQKLYAIRSSFSDTINLGSGLKMVKADIGAIGKFLGKVSKKIKARQDNFIHYDIFLGTNKIGYIQISEDSSTEINIPWFGIDKKYQNNGYGIRVLKGLISYVKKAGFKELTLEVPMDAKPAQHIYEKLGFRYVGKPYDSLINMKLKL